MPPLNTAFRPSITNAVLETQFVRYGADGKLESFQCSPSVTFRFYVFHSDTGGGVSVGECSKNDQLNENMTELQSKGFEAALSAVGSNMNNVRKVFGDALKPQVIQERDAMFIHITQWLLSGVGGAGGHGAAAIETLLMIPPNSKTVFLVQGALPENACQGSRQLPLCNKFRSALREVARRVQFAQATSSVPAAAEAPKSVHAARRTICDDVAATVQSALEESDEKRVSVIETVRYKQLSTQPQVQAFMRAASDEHMQGIDIPTVIKKVADDCKSRHLKF